MARQEYGSGRRGQGGGRNYGDDRDRWSQREAGGNYDDRSLRSGSGYGSDSDYDEDIGRGPQLAERGIFTV